MRSKNEYVTTAVRTDGRTCLYIIAKQTLTGFLLPPTGSFGIGVLVIVVLVCYATTNLAALSAARGQSKALGG